MEFRYRSYEEMKDSGIEWIGEIPKEWIVSKFKYFYTFGMGETILKENLSDNGLPVYSATEEDSVFGKYNNAKLILKEGDIIIPARGNSIGAVKIAKDKCTCTQTTIYAKKIGNIDEKFIYYFMKGNRNYLFYFDQTAIPQITTNQVKENILVYGDVVIQNKIAKFLDEKTAQFDSIISKKEALIEKLEEAKKSLISEVVTGKVKVVKTDDGYELVERKKEEMKYSGVEWIGDIPRQWDVKRIKQISEVISKGTTPSTVGREILETGEIRFLKAENILNGEIKINPEFFIDEDTNKILKRSELKENDILFVIAGATIGKVAMVHRAVCPANTNQAISFIRLKKKVNHKYVYYWLSSAKLQEVMWLNAVQSAQPNLSMENLGNFYIAYPNELELDILTGYIEKTIMRFNKISSKIKEQIEKLKEAKQSLISEAVTGKIEILD